MHGERNERSLSTPSQSMLTDETNTNTSSLTDLGCLPIGCSVSAKYRGAFCTGKQFDELLSIIFFCAFF